MSSTTYAPDLIDSTSAAPAQTSVSAVLDRLAHVDILDAMCLRAVFPATSLTSILLPAATEQARQLAYAAAVRNGSDASWHAARGQAWAAAMTSAVALCPERPTAVDVAALAADVAGAAVVADLAPVEAATLTEPWLEGLRLAAAIRSKGPEAIAAAVRLLADHSCPRRSELIAAASAN